MRLTAPVLRAFFVAAPTGKYQGLDRFEARKALWKDMEEAGLAIKREDYTLRCGMELGKVA